MKAAGARADEPGMDLTAILGRTPGPMSNAERQRRFRERNPGYYARIQARKRASAKRGAKQFLAALRLKRQGEPSLTPLDAPSQETQVAPTAC